VFPYTEKAVRTQRTKIKREQMDLRRSQVLQLRKEGWSNVNIARIMELSESTIRSVK